MSEIHQTTYLDTDGNALPNGVQPDADSINPDAETSTSIDALEQEYLELRFDDDGSKPRQPTGLDPVGKKPVKKNPDRPTKRDYSHRPRNIT